MSRSKQIWVNVPEAFSVPTILAPPVQSWSDRLRILVVLSIERMRGAKAARLAQLPPDMILALVQHTTIVPESSREKLRKPWEFLRSDPLKFISRLVWRLSEECPPLRALPYLLNERSELKPEHFRFDDTKYGSKALPEIWQGPFPCNYLNYDNSYQICMVKYGSFDMEAIEVALRGGRLYSQLRNFGVESSVPFVGVLAEQTRVVAVFNWPRSLGQPQLLSDVLHAEKSKPATYFAVEERVAFADEVARTMQRPGCFELCFLSKRRHLVFLPSLAVITSARCSATSPAMQHAREGAAELLKVVLQFHDNAGVPHPLPDLISNTIEELKDGKCAEQVKWFMPLQHAFFGQWPTGAPIAGKTSLPLLEDTLGPVIRTLLSGAGSAWHDLPFTAMLREVSTAGLQELLDEPWFSGTGAIVAIISNEDLQREREQAAAIKRANSQQDNFSFGSVPASIGSIFTSGSAFSPGPVPRTPAPPTLSPFLSTPSPPAPPTLGPFSFASAASSGPAPSQSSLNASSSAAAAAPLSVGGASSPAPTPLSLGAAQSSFSGPSSSSAAAAPLSFGGASAPAPTAAFSPASSSSSSYAAAAAPFSFDGPSSSAAAPTASFSFGGASSFAAPTAPFSFDVSAHTLASFNAHATALFGAPVTPPQPTTFDLPDFAFSFGSYSAEQTGSSSGNNASLAVSDVIPLAGNAFSFGVAETPKEREGDVFRADTSSAVDRHATSYSEQLDSVSYTVVMKLKYPLQVWFIHKKGCVQLDAVVPCGWVAKFTPNVEQPEVYAPSLRAAVFILASYFNLTTPVCLPIWQESRKLIKLLQEGKATLRSGRRYPWDS